MVVKVWVLQIYLRATGSADELASYSVRRCRNLIINAKDPDATIQNSPLRSRRPHSHSDDESAGASQRLQQPDARRIS